MQKDYTVFGALLISKQHIDIHALILAFETFKKHGIFGSSELNFEENYGSMATRFKVSLKQGTILSNYMKQATVL